MGLAQRLKCLLGKLEVLSSIPGTKNKQTKKSLHIEQKSKFIQVINYLENRLSLRAKPTLKKEHLKS